MEGITRFGQPTAQTDGASASFRCAACGEMAGVVRTVAAGRPVDMGPPLGTQSQASDGVVVDYFGGTAWRHADAQTFQAVQAILTGEQPDPVALHKIDWELAPFYCPDCDLNYCRPDWNAHILLDEGFYDCTVGICPNGHRHTIDD